MADRETRSRNTFTVAAVAFRGVSRGIIVARENRLDELTWFSTWLTNAGSFRDVTFASSFLRFGGEGGVILESAWADDNPAVKVNALVNIHIDKSACLDRNLDLIRFS